MTQTDTMEPEFYIEPMSLYLALQKDSFASLEALAEVALSFGAAVRDAAFIIDPSIDVRIELRSGAEGSFSFNTLIKALNPRDALSRINLKALSYLCLIWFSSKGAEYAFEKVLDHFFANQEMQHISDVDQQAIAQKVIDLLKKDIAKDKVQSVYRSLNSDPVIIGVGATRDHTTAPTDIVPRHEFAARAGASMEQELKAVNRSRENRETLTLISPVLLADSPRRWRVRGADGEFGASVKDESFLKSLTHGDVAVQMVSDIQLNVELQTKETFEHGVWVVKERNILKVYGISLPDRQQVLDLRESALRPKSRSDSESDTED